MKIKSVPNTISINLPKTERGCRDHLKSYFLQECGGYTETEAEGAWRDSSGKTHKDGLIILTSSSDQRINVEKILETAFNLTTQEAFYFTLNGEAFIAERTIAEAPPL